MDCQSIYLLLQVCLGRKNNRLLVKALFVQSAASIAELLHLSCESFANVCFAAGLVLIYGVSQDLDLFTEPQIS